MPPTAAQVVADAEARVRPCVRLAPGGDGRSRLGGIPNMVSEWPRNDGRSLGCIAQLDLEAVRAAAGPEWLPAEGRLMFFYDFELWSSGLSAEDAGSFAVI